MTRLTIEDLAARVKRLADRLDELERQKVLHVHVPSMPIPTSPTWFQHKPGCPVLSAAAAGANPCTCAWRGNSMIGVVS